MPLRDVADAKQQPRVLDAQPLVESPSRPVALLVLPTHSALEVDAPCLGIRIEVQGSKRNLDFDGPAHLAATHVRVPDAIPLTIGLPGRTHQRIRHQPRRVHLEVVAVARVKKRVEFPDEPIVGTQPFVALHRVAEQLVRLVVEAVDAHVERVAREREAHFGWLGWRRAGLRDLLLEVGGRDRSLPDRFVEPTVQCDRLPIVEPHGGDHRTCQLLGGSLRFGCTDGRHEAHE
jgi:hypothetical protein